LILGFAEASQFKENGKCNEKFWENNILKPSQPHLLTNVLG